MPSWQSPYGRIVKLVLVEGEWGKKPSENSECLIEITESDNLELKQYENDKTIIIGDSDNYLERLFDICLSTMNKSEVAKFDVIGPQPVCFTLRLVELKFDASIYQWRADKKFQIAVKHKNRGVDLFRVQKTKDASYRFAKALKIICSIPIDALTNPEKVDEVFVKDINQLKANLFNNLASCFLKIEAWGLVTDSCKKVLRYGDDVKARYKLGVALKKERHFEEAEKEFEMVLSREPGNKAALEHLRGVKREIAEENAHFNCMVKKMFKA